VDLHANGTIVRVDRLLEETYRAERRHFWFRGFRRFVRPLLATATAGVEHPRLLDCGCGTGANLNLLKEFGAPFGFDLTARGLQFAHEAHRSNLCQASVTTIPFGSASFDVLTSFDVLYCLPDPDETLAIQEMHRVLRPGGALIVNVAAMEMLRGDHSVLGAEVRRYTAARLRRVLEREGFRIVRLTYTNAVLFPLVATVRVLQRLRGLPKIDETRGDFRVPPAPINALLSGALAVEALTVAAGINMPVGSSLLCLARKVS
jgi:SAM-dependent methyltransferase